MLLHSWAKRAIEVDQYMLPVFCDPGPSLCGQYCGGLHYEMGHFSSMTADIGPNSLALVLLCHETSANRHLRSRLLLKGAAQGVRCSCGVSARVGRAHHRGSAPPACPAVQPGRPRPDARQGDGRLNRDRCVMNHLLFYVPWVLILTSSRPASWQQLS